jgi:hypothetical protein
MQNGARHAIGVLTGLVTTPVLAAGLLFGASRLTRVFTGLRLDGPDRWVGTGAILAVAVLLGVLAGSRMSPLASLIPGLVFGTAGALWVIDPRLAMRTMGEKLPAGLDRGHLIAGPSGVLLLVGVFLLVASLSPSRWAARRPHPAGEPPSGRGGPIPPYGQGAPPEAVTPRSHDPRSRIPAPQAPPAQWEAGHGAGPGQGAVPGHAAVPGHGAGPGHGAVPAQRSSPEQLPGPFGAAPFEPGPSAPPAASSPPPLPSSRPERPARDGDEDEAGGWTQMYGTRGPAKDE